MHLLLQRSEGEGEGSGLHANDNRLIAVIRCMRAGVAHFLMLSIWCSFSHLRTFICSMQFDGIHTKRLKVIVL